MLSQIIKSDCGCEFEILPTGQLFRWCPLHKAAPDMYEALKELMERFNGGVRFPLQSTCDKANQALADAEGK